MLTFSFNGVEGRMTIEEILTSGMVGRQVRFILSPDWDGMRKTAVYMAGDRCVIHTNAGTVDTIPQEVLEKPMERLYVGIYGISPDGKQVTPTIRAEGPMILPGIAPGADEGADPALPVWAQLLDMIGDMDLLNTARRDSLVSAINSIPAGGGGQTGSVFAGQTALFFGDSLTEVNSHYTKGYHQWVKELLGLKSYVNYGKSGYKVSDVYNKVNSVTDSAPLVVVMCGVNDQTFSVPLGTLGDSSADTTYGSLELLCALLKSKYPTSAVVFLTPHYQTKYPHSGGITSREVAKAVREVCEKHAIPVYDNFRLSGIHTANLGTFTTDNCHWNDAGHEMVGKNLAAFLNQSFRYLHGVSGGDSGGEEEPAKTVDYISAVFDQRGVEIYDTTPLNDLKQYLTLTAYYTDGTSAVVTGYTLSGTLKAGQSTVTIAYGGDTATIIVTVTASGETQVTLTGISATLKQGSLVVLEGASPEILRDYLTVTAQYSNGTTAVVTDYTLSGTLTAGSSTVTVSYSGKTDTVTVYVTAYSVPEKTVEVTGVKMTDGTWHLCLYVTREKLAQLSDAAPVYGFTMKPLTDYVPRAGATGGMYTMDTVNDLAAGYTNFGSLGHYASIEDNSDGTYDVTMTQVSVTTSASRAYWCFPVCLVMAVGTKFILSDYYVQIGGTRYDIHAVGGAFKEETCTIS